MRTFVLLLLSSLLLACSGLAKKEPVGVADVKALGQPGIENLHRVGNIYIASQPEESTIAALGTTVPTIINMRGPSEMQFDEKAKVEAAGATYALLPFFAEEGGIDAASLEAASQMVLEAGDEAVMVHCASGNRAGAWLAYHLAKHHRMSVDEAFNVGRAAGLTSDALAERTREFIEQ